MKSFIHEVYDYSGTKALMFKDWINEFLSGGDPFPVCFEFSLTNRCNLNCIWCTERYWREKYMTEISFSVAKSAIKEMSELGTKAITFEGGGEPTTYNKLSDIIDFSHDVGIESGLITNGVLLDNIRHVYDKLTYVRISLDSYDKKSFYVIKQRDHFDRVVHNIDLVCKSSSDTIVGVSYILKKPINTDIEGISLLIEKLRDIGIDYIQFKPIMEFDKNITTRKFVIYEDIIEKLNELKSLYEDKCFKIFISRGKKQPNIYPTCYSHRLKGYIAPTGDVYLCCIRKLFEDKYGKENLVFGNIYDRSLKEIWSSEKRKKIIDKVESLGEKYTRKCPACVHMPYNYVLDILKNGNKWGMNSFI